MHGSMSIKKVTVFFNHTHFCQLMFIAE